METIQRRATTARRRHRSNASVAALIALAFAAPTRAQTFDLSWNTIDGGGMLIVGGGFELAGTIGQPDAGPIPSMTGGDYALVGGFWAKPAPCRGDVNGDRLVELTDLAILLAHFGTAGGATLADGDLDGDGDVELDDLTEMLSRFGMFCA